jgi:hypothetical protein
MSPACNGNGIVFFFFGKIFPKGEIQNENFEKEVFL